MASSETRHPDCTGSIPLVFISYNLRSQRQKHVASTRTRIDDEGGEGNERKNAMIVLLLILVVVLVVLTYHYLNDSNCGYHRLFHFR